MKAARRSFVLASQGRLIHSAYGGFPNQGAGDVASMMSWGACRGSIQTHFRLDNTIEGLSPAGTKLASAIRHDTDRLMHTDWTTDFSAFWDDQVHMHENEYVNLYEGGLNPLISLFTSVENATTEEKDVVKKDLKYLQACHKWANKSNEIYTYIFDERFRMQREVFDPVEREKILASCTEMVEKFRDEVPADFRKKAAKDVEWHLWNLRHWVWDAPATKAVFKNTMN
ncbi:succinate dehydrogenase subunit [Diplonema papillatum]|nr:succinate dehydrogenase subunit [Diplonema papillatum]